MLTGLSLRLRVLLIFAGLAGTVLAVFLFALWVEARRMSQAGIDMGEATSPMVLAGFIAGLGAVLAIVAVWFLFDRFVAHPIETLAGGLRTGQSPDLDQARYLADLGPAARDAAEARARSAEALAQAMQDHAAEQAREKAALESILSDFGAAAVMTDTAGRVVFYNAAAGRMMPGLGLDRPLARHLRSGALDAARVRLVDGGVAATDLTALTVDGTRLTGRMRLMDDGTLLILRDRPAARPESRAAFEALRRRAATLVPMLEVLDGPIPPALAQAIRAEGQGLANAMRSLSDADKPDDSGACAQLAELAVGLDTGGAPLPRLSVQAQAGPVNALLRALDGHLRAQGHAPRLVVDTADAAEVRLLLEWQGAALPMDRLEAWLAEPPDHDQPDLSGADLLAAQATGIWAEHDDPAGPARLVLPLPRAAEADVSGGLTYDFALASRGAASSQLADLTCVVFDTETTGLEPTDRIVQIAGVRIAGGRLTGERFETLVNPGRPIPPASTKIHGVTDQMVKDAPDMAAALVAFHHFAEDAALVAHNAPFDMGMLHSAAPETGAHFDNRVLDTVLLSAMVWGQSAPHTLDALCERLQITIPEELRHTAMGDTEATAQAFLQLIPALAAKGIKRFEDMQVEARKHRRLIGDANQDAAKTSSS
ncbi:exonuclease domain-containing protein [Paracoccus tegillarcae]|uniref:DNA-directed DNA polymerase n=1 Tax=Paracoccus tegillarcae TaxID=1529068 RepID=A0A2K9EIF7_9RHOB|nr:exonuclease domain-containing protein [Paracoccus tegillarcae]AUH34149.1 3'-5' exonuclease [Paracoccus tegillarcae]